jgi:hypothetical protein
MRPIIRSLIAASLPSVALGGLAVAPYAVIAAEFLETLS